MARVKHTSERRSKGSKSGNFGSSSSYSEVKAGRVEKKSKLYVEVKSSCSQRGKRKERVLFPGLKYGKMYLVQNQFEIERIIGKRLKEGPSGEKEWMVEVQFANEEARLKDIVWISDKEMDEIQWLNDDKNQSGNFGSSSSYSEVNAGRVERKGKLYVKKVMAKEESQRGKRKERVLFPGLKYGKMYLVQNIFEIERIIGKRLKEGPSGEKEWMVEVHFTNKEARLKDVIWNSDKEIVKIPVLTDDKYLEKVYEPPLEKWVTEDCPFCPENKTRPYANLWNFKLHVMTCHPSEFKPEEWPDRRVGKLGRK